MPGVNGYNLWIAIQIAILIPYLDDFGPCKRGLSEKCNKNNSIISKL